MSRADNLTPFEAERIRNLAALGRTREEISELTGRSPISVWRVLTGRRLRPLWRENHAAALRAKSSLEMISPLSLEIRIGLASMQQEAKPMTTREQVRITFIDALTLHFPVKRSEPDRFFADLELALVDEGFDEAVLARAARTLIRTRMTATFPTVATCIATCRVAAEELTSEAKTKPAESRTRASESLVSGGSSPVQGDADLTRRRHGTDSDTATCGEKAA